MQCDDFQDEISIIPKATQLKEWELVRPQIMNLNTAPLAIVTMSEVANRISLKDSEAAKKWCKANGITVHKVSKKDFVYNFDLEYTVTKPFVHDIQHKHPEHWKDILKDVLECDALYNYFLLNLGQPRFDEALTDFEPMDEGQEKLLKRILQ